MEKTRQAGIGMKLPTANTKTSDRLARVMDGPTSTSALLILPSRGMSKGCRLTECTNMHILSTPTCYKIKRVQKVSYDRQNLAIER